MKCHLYMLSPWRSLTDWLDKIKHLFFPNKLFSEENSDIWKKVNLKHHRSWKKQWYFRFYMLPNRSVCTNLGLFDIFQPVLFGRCYGVIIHIYLPIMYFQTNPLLTWWTSKIKFWSRFVIPLLEKKIIYSQTNSNLPFRGWLVILNL